MGKSKAITKGDDATKRSKESKKPTVKEGRVTKPAQTPKAKSKEIAKSAASNHAVRELSKKKAKKAPTPDPESDSSDSDSESAVSTKSDSNSSASSSEDDKTVTKVPIKANGVAKSGAIVESDDSSDASSESSDDSSEDDSSENDVPKSRLEKGGAAGPKINGVKSDGVAKSAVRIETHSESHSSEEDDSSDESDSSEDEDKKPAADAKINGSAKVEVVKQAEASSDSESDSDSDSDDSSASESEKEEVPTKKRKAELESAPVIKKTKTHEESGDGIKNLFVGNLSWNIDEEWLARDFGKFGDIVGCRIVTDRESGRSRGFGYVEYSTSTAAKAAQAAMHQFSLDGRALNVDFSAPRQKAGEKSGERAKRFGDALGTPSNTLFIGNISFDATNEMISEAFGEYGTLTRVSLPTDRETGAPKGFGYVDFTSADDAKAALEALTGAEIAGRPIRLDYAAPRDGNSGPPQRGGFGNRGRGGDRGRGGRGGGFGGRGGGRGGRPNSTNRGGFGDFKGSKVTF